MRRHEWLLCRCPVQRSIGLNGLELLRDVRVANELPDDENLIGMIGNKQ